MAGALEAREIDCAIGILQPRHRGIEAELLFREQYVAITASDWRPVSGRVGAQALQLDLVDAGDAGGDQEQ